ncbi:MAG: tetratricopeptide repeat protein [Bacteroidales bacterium]
MGGNIKFTLIAVLLMVTVVSCNQSGKDSKDNKNGEAGQESDIVSDSLSIEQLSEKIRETPRNAVLFRKRAEMYAEKGETEKAIDDLNVALKLDSVTKSTYYKLIDQHMNLGQSGKAKEAAKACLEVHPNDKESLLRLAQIYYYVKEYNKALSYIREIKKHNKQDADTYFIQGLIYRESEKPDLAINAFQRTIEYDDEFIAAYVMLGKMLSDANDPLAGEYYKAGLRKAPDNVELHYNTGFYLQQNDMIDSALNHYQYIIDSIDDKHYGAHYNTGYIALVYQNDYNKAIAEFTEAINIDSTSHKAYYNRGYAHELKGELKEARADYNKSLEFKENYSLAIEALNMLDQQ